VAGRCPGQELFSEETITCTPPTPSLSPPCCLRSTISTGRPWSVRSPPVVADYTLLWGGEPERLPSTELVSRWQRLLPGFDATQHLIGPVVVTRADEHSATCATAVRAYHRTS